MNSRLYDDFYHDYSYDDCGCSSLDEGGKSGPSGKVTFPRDCKDPNLETYVDFIPHALDRMEKREHKVYKKDAIKDEILRVLDFDEVRCLMVNTVSSTCGRFGAIPKPQRYDRTKPNKTEEDQRACTYMFGIHILQRRASDDLYVPVKATVTGKNTWLFEVKTVHVGPRFKDGKPFEFEKDHRIIKVDRKNVTIEPFEVNINEMKHLMTFESFIERFI
jgi:hypothetical protein